jgi:glycosyltransferase involved in cell wall biosynthesis
MKKKFSMILLICLLFGISGVCSYSERKSNNAFKTVPKKIGTPDISKYNFLWKKLKRVKPETQKHFVVIIPSYNNSKRYKRNLDSIFMQKYDNYHIIYIDDCSPDGTGDLVEKYIKEKKQEHRVILIKNRERRKAMANIYKAVNMCDDFDIIASCDGDDWWSNDHVLSLLNKIYQDPNVWITHGSLMHWPSNKIVKQKAYPKTVIAKNKFREFGWQSCGLRSYYAWLFKKIKIEDLMFKGKFVEANSDYVMVFPMLEMAGFRHAYIPDVLYVADRSTGLNDFRVNKKIQKEIGVIFRHKEKYLPLPKNSLL